MAQEARTRPLPTATEPAAPATAGPGAMDRVDAALEWLWHFLTSMRLALVLILAIAALGVESFRSGQMLTWDKETRRPATPNGSAWAANWETRSQNRERFAGLVNLDRRPYYQLVSAELPEIAVHNLNAAIDPDRPNRL